MTATYGATGGAVNGNMVDEERQTLQASSAATGRGPWPAKSQQRPRWLVAIAIVAFAVASSSGVASLLVFSKQRRHAEPRKTSSQLYQTAMIQQQLQPQYLLDDMDDVYDDLPIEIIRAVGSDKDNKQQHNTRFETDTSNIPLLASTNRKYWSSPTAHKRCDHVIDVFQQRAEAFGAPRSALVEEYKVQSANYNVFFRATAQLFWLDFAGGHWANFTLSDIGIQPSMDGVPLTKTSLYTWITGDQHMSNFGAWKNRGGDVVFGVNDFDEAAIYDFHIDVLRIAVSVCNHAYMNGFKPNAIKNIVYAFLGTYVSKVFSYVGNDIALVSEITPKTAQGTLQDFLVQIEKANSHNKQIDKYTVVDKKTGERRLLKSNATKLQAVADADLEDRIKQAFTVEHYGATMMKVGFRVREWTDDYNQVIDVARRVGSGIGSYGVDRYYVLLNGNDGHKGGSAVILDVKYEPWGAVSRVLSPSDAAWYHVMFPHEAARAVAAQRALTSFTDPFTGWVMINDRAFVVRQRSPWKASPDLDALTDKEDFTVFAEQIAIATATSHVRGSVSKSPAQFKHMLFVALEEYRHRKAWRKAITQLALNYHDQVLLDYKCFQEYVEENYSSS